GKVFKSNYPCLWWTHASIRLWCNFTFTRCKGHLFTCTILYLFIYLFIYLFVAFVYTLFVTWRKKVYPVLDPIIC
ncbi:MAG: hypothetical protein N7Q72_03845, partial [Spiroplasma sp. Tabriz.8]|nr:hypothetical protein [Spiroplasma sp. Tabriz.8]